MSLFGLAEKKRIAELEKQVADQQLIIDQMLKLTERSLNAYADAHNIASEALAIAKRFSEKYSDDYEEDYDPKYKTTEFDDDLRNLFIPEKDDY
ncbi:hypothetical protein [Phascolarctobacterium sp.]